MSATLLALMYEMLDYNENFPAKRQYSSLFSNYNLIRIVTELLEIDWTTKSQFIE